MTAPDRLMRTLKFAIVVSVLLFIYVARIIPSKAAQPPQHPVELIVAVFAILNVAVGLNGRRVFGRLAQANAGRSTSTTPLNQWLTANIFSLAMMESCALFALVLHLLGSQTILVGLLFGCALLALLVWSPGASPATDNGQSHE